MGYHAYDVNAKWDDPFERREERREAARFQLDIKMKLSITASNPAGNGSLVGPGVLLDVSQGGVLVATKHQLSPGDNVTLAIPTDICPQSMCLPEVFLGPARVVRVEALSDRVIHAALVFGSAFEFNMEFAMFVDFLSTMARVLRAT